MAVTDLEHKDVNSELEKKVGGPRKEPQGGYGAPPPQHPAPALVCHKGAAKRAA